MTLKHQERYCERGNWSCAEWLAEHLFIPEIQRLDVLEGKWEGKAQLHHSSLPAVTGGAKGQTCGECEAVLSPMGETGSTKGHYNQHTVRMSVCVRNEKL